MIDNENIQAMAASLYSEGVATFADEEGNRLVIATTAVFGLSGGEFMLAYENHGTAFFTTHRPMNQYRLAHAGFSLRSASVLADIVNRLFAVVATMIGDNKTIEEGLVPIGEQK